MCPLMCPQVAIVLRTPPYRDLNISGPVSVFMQLRKKSDDSIVSDPKSYQYFPRDKGNYSPTFYYIIYWNILRKY